MRRSDKAALLFPAEGTIGLVDDLPSLQEKRLGDGACLVLAGPDALEGDFAAVTGGDGERIVLAADACRRQ